MKRKLYNIYSALFENTTNAIVIQAFRYFLVGGVAFLADISILFILKTFFNLNYLYSAGIAFTIGLIVNFALSISWIFNKNKFSISAIFGLYFLIFIFTGVIGLVLTEIFMYIFTDIVNLNFILSKINTVPLVLIWNFLSRKVLISRRFS